MKPLAVAASTCLLITAALFNSGAALAQSSPDTLVQFGGQMHSAAEICGGYTADELRKMKQAQKDQAIAMGMAAAEFETNFQLGYEAGQEKLTKASEAEKSKMCAQLKAMGSPK